MYGLVSIAVPVCSRIGSLCCVCFLIMLFEFSKKIVYCIRTNFHRAYLFIFMNQEIHDIVFTNGPFPTIY